MDSSVNILLQLLRAALGNKAAGGELSPDVDWKEVIDLAFEQGVAAIAVDGLQKSFGSTSSPTEPYAESLELSLDSPELEDLKYEWFGEVFRCEEDYGNYKQTIIGLAKFYQSIGIRMMVLKGYGLSLNYPIPSHRPCGDIDVYLFGSGTDADRLVSEKLGIKVNLENPKHSVFSFKGVTVENHYTFTDVLESNANARTEQVLEKYVGNCVKSDLGCYLPSGEWNYIFLLRHFGKHFGIRTSVNLRQIIDWGLFLKSLPMDFDIDGILKDVKSVGLERLNNLATSLAEDILGFDFSRYITERPSIKERERVFEDIFSAPNAKFSENIIVSFAQRVFCFFSQRWKYKYLPESYTENLWYKVKTIRVFWK